MKFAFIDAERAAWPVRAMCRVFRVSSSGFYAWKSRPESTHAREDRRIGVLVRTTHERSRQRYGSPRIHADLRFAGLRTSRKRIIRIMGIEGVRARSRRTFVRTTDSRHDHAVAPNLLNRDFTAANANDGEHTMAALVEQLVSFLATSAS